MSVRIPIIGFLACTLIGMHRISGRIIRPFLYPVSSRIPDFTAGYPAVSPVRPDTRYQAYVDLTYHLIFLQIRSGKEVCTDIILVTRKFFAFRLERIVIFKACS
jgi:hypothetical protein